MDLIAAHSRSLRRAALKTMSALSPERRDYVIGIALLLAVVFLWACSNFLTQNLFQDGYEKPFLVTYLNTSSFAMYLIPLALKKAFWRDFGSSVVAGTQAADGYQAVATNDAEAIDANNISGPSREQSRADESALPPLTMRETVQLAFVFCFIWFAANWTVNASLGYTSVASATIMSSMSGFFTLGIGRMFRVETLTLIKVVAVVVSFSGVILVSLSDSSKSSSTTTILSGAPSLKGAIAEEKYSSLLFGDALALTSAIFYAFYVILLKVRIRSESRINMQLFFGFVGLFNIFCCWPVGFILHGLGMEEFELPSGGRVIAALVINMFITFSSDFIYVIAMLKTTPLVVTIGLSLTIPVAVAGDLILKNSVQMLSLLGALLVLVSFVVIGLEDLKMEETSALALEETQDEEHGHVVLRLSSEDLIEDD